MKRFLSFLLTILLLLQLPCSAAAEGSDASEDRIVLTIGDVSTRSGNRYNENMGMWQYLADKVGVEIKYE